MGLSSLFVSGHAECKHLFFVSAGAVHSCATYRKPILNRVPKSCFDHFFELPVCMVLDLHADFTCFCENKHCVSQHDGASIPTLAHRLNPRSPCPSPLAQLMSGGNGQQGSGPCSLGVALTREDIAWIRQASRHTTYFPKSLQGMMLMLRSVHARQGLLLSFRQCSLQCSLPHPVLPTAHQVVVRGQSPERPKT